MSANRMMRALQGKLWGALFFLVFAFLLCSGSSMWPGLGPRAALIPPRIEELQKRSFRTLLEPLAEFWVVLFGDLDGDRFLIDCQRSDSAAALILDDGRHAATGRFLVCTRLVRASRIDRLKSLGAWSVVGQGGDHLFGRIHQVYLSR